MTTQHFLLSALLIAGHGIGLAAGAEPSLVPAPSAGLPPGVTSVDFSPQAWQAISDVLEHPTFTVHGPVEGFRANPAVYNWLLDHPDQAVDLWRRLGATCTAVSATEDGRFNWTDGQGGAVWWRTAWTSPRGRVWYGEGTVRPSPVLGPIRAKAVVVLQIRESKDFLGRSVIRHQAEVFLQTDSKTAQVIARLLGRTATRSGEHLVGQMEVFFSALAWYLDRNPAFLTGLSLPVGVSASR